MELCETKDTLERQKLLILDFSQNENLSQMEITDVDQETRKELHAYCHHLKLFSVSRGEKSTAKCLVISKTKSAVMVTTEQLSDVSKKLIIQQFKLPIPCTHSKHMEYFAQLFEGYYPIKSTFNLALDAVNTFGESKFFFDEMPQIEKTIKLLLEKVDGYKLFMDSFPFEKFRNIKTEIKLPPNAKFYEKEFDGKFFISLDLRSANFRALHYFDPALVFGATSWKEFIEKLKGHPFMIENKKWRLGVLDRIYSGSRMQAIWEFLILETLLVFLKQGAVQQGEFIAWSSDEIIFIVDDFESGQAKKFLLESILLKFFPERKEWYKLELFRLVHLGQGKFFVKELFLNTTDPTMFKPVFKGGNGSELVQCFKRYFKIPLNDIDFCRGKEKKANAINFQIKM